MLSLRPLLLQAMKVTTSNESYYMQQKLLQVLSLAILIETQSKLSYSSNNCRQGSFVVFKLNLNRNVIFMKKLASLVLTASLSLGFASAAQAEKPLIVVGASYANATTPFNDNLQAPLGGISIGFGDYLSLGDALVRDRRLSGHVVNEAQAGATSFDRIACNPVCDSSIMWQGYDKQLTKALARVTTRDLNGDVISINADYVIVTFTNDCLHSDAFGIPQDEAVPCDTAAINEKVDNLVALGQRVVDLGLTPIFPIPPQYNQLDLPFFRSTFGLNWAADEANYNELLQIRFDRIRSEVPEAVQLKIWNKFAHVGDGIHPDRKSVVKAAKEIAKYIKRQEEQAAE